MTRNRRAPALALALLASVSSAPSSAEEVVAVTTPRATTAEGPRQMYTTYFYTAAEAVIQGYSEGTHVRVFELASHRPIFAGSVNEGESVHVPTGAGVFGFVSDRKASILVGTPSACSVVGYWGRDEDGRFVSDHMFVGLPQDASSPDDRVVVWASEASHVVIRDRTAGATLFEGDLDAGARHVIESARLATMGTHVLDVRSDHESVAVQVYYDEGFSVPSTTGRTSGREFSTYVGRTTEGVNDLVVTSYGGDASVHVEDLDTHEVLFDGTVARGAAHAITMHERYVHVRADRDVAVTVVPFVHYQGAYAEHHFSGGAEGTGIDTEFLVTTPHDLWLFSYFDRNAITVTNAANGTVVWEGTLAAGGSTGISPGQGLYRVRASGGASVMGGANSCGGEYSPAGRLFAVDDAVMQAVAEVRRQRVQAAAARGTTLSPSAAAAPLSAAELRTVTSSVQGATGSRVFDEEAVRQRIDAMTMP